MIEHNRASVRAGLLASQALSQRWGVTMAAEKVCDACGERNPPGTQFCQFCGNYLGWSEDETTQEPPASPRKGSEAEAPAAVPSPALDLDDEAGFTAPPLAGLHQTGPVADQPRVPRRPAVEPATRPSAPPERTADVSPVAASAPPHEPPIAPSTIVCPNCGQRNDPGRTLCSRCGYVVNPRHVDAGGPVVPRKKGWWARLWDPDDRAARRAYRRSLPSRYRWFRAAIITVAVGGVIGLAFALARDPVGWIKEAWYDMRGETVVVSGVSVATQPEGAAVTGFEARNAIDRDIATAWGIGWTTDTPEARACGDVRGLGSLEITLSQPTRIQQILILAGLGPNDADRDGQFRPREIHISWADEACVSLPLDDTDEVQTRDLDTGDAVDRLTVTVASVYAPDPSLEPIDQVSITELQLRQHPS